MSAEINLWLPWPPSINHLWRNVVVGRAARTVISKEGRKWFEAAALEVMRQRENESIDGRIKVEIVLCPPNRVSFDIDNRVKAILDACTKGGLWCDDGKVDVLTVRRGDVYPGGHAFVFAAQIEDEQ